MMEFKEFIGKSLGDLISENKARPVGTIDNDRYEELSKSKSRIENLRDLSVNVKDVIKAKPELLGITRRVFELENIKGPEKITLAEEIENSLLTTISNLNIDLELVGTNSPEEESIFESLAVANYIYEEFLYSIIASKPKDKLQTPSEWADEQKMEYLKIKASLKSDLEMADKFDNAGAIKDMSANERSTYGPRWISAIQPLLAQANERADAFPAEIAYSNWKTELMKNFKEVMKDWNLEEIKQKRKEDVELMSLEDVVDELISLEVPYWDSSYGPQENNEYKVALVEKIRWRNFDEEKKEWIGLGWEDYAALTGQATKAGDEKFEQTFNNLERRELVIKLQVAALESLQMRRKGFAEGDRSLLFENLTKSKLNREQLLLATTCHPRYGAYLTKILKIAQELPILRGGKLPPEAKKFSLSPIEFSIKDKSFKLNRKNKKGPIDDRVVLRKSKNGVLPVLLHRDIYWEIEDPDDSNIILDRGFIPAELPKKGDKYLYTYNKNYNYESLSNDTGRPTRDRMIQDIMTMLDDDPAKFGLEKEDIPDKKDKEKAQWFAGKLFYTFPFLSYILAKRKETTQTDSHNTDLEEDINWMLVFSPQGHAIHSSQRYGAANVAWMWLLPYYPKLKEGHYGASGDAERLNNLRDLMIKHQECFFDTKLFDGQVFAKDKKDNDIETNDVLLPPFGASEFLSPLNMITPSPQENVALKGNGIGRRGETISATPTKPVYIGFDGKIDTTEKAKEHNGNLRNFDLLKTAISGWLDFLKKTLDDMSKELEDEDIAEGVGEKKAILGQLMGDFLGKAKMFYTDKEEWKDTELEGFDHLFGVARPILWHLIERTFYASRYSDIHSRKALFSKALEAVAHNMTKGGLSSGSAGRMAAWIYKTMKGVDEDIRYGVKGDFEGMNVSLAPPDRNSWGNRREKVFEYLKALWKWKRETSEGGAMVYGDFPLWNDLGMLKPQIVVAQKSNPQPHIAHFQAMMKKESDLESPVTRSGLKTGSSKEDKE